ncbi:MAG: hypothetical protein V7K46_24200 [Nostoc sp.]
MVDSQFLEMSSNDNFSNYNHSFSRSNNNLSVAYTTFNVYNYNFSIYNYSFSSSNNDLSISYNTFSNDK